MRDTVCAAGLMAWSLLGLAAARQAPAAPLKVVVSEGRDCGVSFGARAEPYREGMRSITACYFWNHQNVTDADGLAVTGLGFYGWRVGDRVTVAVFTLVPARGAPNRYLANNGDDTEHLTRLKPLATYTLSRGQSQAIDPMRALGLQPFTIRVE